MSRNNDVDDDQDQTDLVPRSQIRQLEEQAREAKELRAQLDKVTRDNAFARALGTTDHPARQYFEKGYDGELDVESIRNAAKDAGLIAGPTSVAPAEQTQHDGPTPQEMAAQARMSAAAEGAPGNRPVDLIEAFGPRGSKSPEEILEMCRAAGRRISDDMQ